MLEDLNQQSMKSNPMRCLSLITGAPASDFVDLGTPDHLSPVLEQLRRQTTEVTAKTNVDDDKADDVIKGKSKEKADEDKKSS